VGRKIAEQSAPRCLAVMYDAVPFTIAVKILSIVKIKSDEMVLSGKSPENSNPMSGNETAEGPYFVLHRINPRQHDVARLRVRMVGYREVIAQQEAFQEIAQGRVAIAVIIVLKLREHFKQASHHVHLSDRNRRRGTL
jgi:hypothetical protein